MVYRNESTLEENELNSNEIDFPSVSTEDDVSKWDNEVVEPVPDVSPIGTKLFEDPYFPANNFSLYQSLDKIETEEELEWKRPKEFASNPRKAPKFFVDGFSRFDVRQGFLGDCWFLATCASLATVPELFVKVVPEDNVEFDADDYQGKFHFHFWQYGEWVTIVVDDRLPVDKNGNLLYGQTSTENEFWLALLEKAYAKLHGSYEALEYGYEEDAMVDLTGGLKKYYTLKKIKPEKLFGIVERSLQQKCLITTGTDEHLDHEKVNISATHAYSVTKVADSTNSDVKLICIRNPWGRSEWNGAWSDDSDMWKTVSDERMKQLNIVKEDGEFWMDINNLVDYFNDLSICYPSPGDFVASQNQDESSWQTVSQHGGWFGESAAGDTDKETFYRNPQYLLTLEDRRSNELISEDTNCSGKSFNTIVGLMQKYNRTMDREDFSIALAIFPVPEGMDLTQGPLPKSFFDNTEAISDKHSGKKRETIFNQSLSAGRYVLVPHTSEPRQRAQFFIRIFSEGAITITYMTQEDEA